MILLQEMRDALFGGCGHVVDIPWLQAWLECAWQTGFDSCVHLTLPAPANVLILGMSRVCDQVLDTTMALPYSVAQCPTYLLYDGGLGFTTAGGPRSSHATIHPDH